MKIRYIGKLPPPYGGVTIKNQLLYQTISEKIDIAYFIRPAYIPAPIHQALNMLLALKKKQTLVIGISAVGGKSRILTKMLYILNRDTMKRSLYFMMGGTEAKRIADNPKEIEWYRNYRRIYVETQSMVECLERAGLSNVKLFPNCRRRPVERFSTNGNMVDPLKCVFFSLIQPAKGADVVLQAAENLPKVNFVFYGYIDADYRKEFLTAMDRLGNVQYKGVFQGSDIETYAELSQYDVLLFPTKWKNEGVPGVLVEAKIVGLPSIVSNECYNAELVKDREEGIVLRHNSPEELKKAILELDKDRALLNRLKSGSRMSAEKFFIENYINEILETLPRGG